MKFKRTTLDDGRPLYTFPNDKTYIVPGDIHFPIHNPTLVTKATLNKSCDVLFLQGDTGDQEGFSRFPKDPEKIAKSNSMVREKDNWKKYLDLWLKEYKYIIIGPGNHEYRAQKLVFGNPGFIGMDWWWPYGSLFNDNRIILLDHGYRAIIGNCVVEHGDMLKGSTGKCPAYSVAESARDGLFHIFGHTHKVGSSYFTSFKKGKAVVTTGINIGTLVDTKKVDYTYEPNWQAGYACIVPGNVETYEISK